MRKRDSRSLKKELPDICAGFQEAAVEVIARKALAACVEKRVRRLVVGGGVIANRRLRELLDKHFSPLGIEVCVPDFALCQDNAAMVAGWGYQLYRLRRFADLKLEAVPNLKV